MWEQRYGFPEPAAHRVRLPPLHRRRRRGAAPRRAPTASAGCRSRRRSSARATTSDGVRPPVDLRRGRGDRPGAPGRRCCASRRSRAVAGDRARDARPRRRAGALRRLPGASASTATSSTRYRRMAAQADAPPCSRTSRPSRARRGRAGRDPDRPRRRARQRVGGHRRRARATRPACWPGSSPACRSRRPDDLERRFEAIWTIDPRATRRAAEVAARLAGAVPTRSTGASSRTLLADRPLAIETPAPALTALTNRTIAYLERRVD